MTLSPLFIVGVPRSGTTLLTAIFAAHSQLQGMPETFFFRELRKQDVASLLATNNWPNEATDFLMSLGEMDVSLHNLLGLTREDIYEYLTNEPPSVRSIFGALADQHTNRNGKKSWVEKTPEHTLYLPAIRRYYPEAYIIKIVRDPRDVAMSLVRAEWFKADIAEALKRWNRFEQRSWQFIQYDEKSTSITYEALVANPKGVVQSICDFIGLSFEPNMLDTRRSSASVVYGKDARWQDNVRQSINPTNVEKWRREMDAENLVLAEGLCHVGLVRYGYPITTPLWKRARKVGKRRVLRQTLNILFKK